MRFATTACVLAFTTFPLAAHSDETGVGRETDTPDLDQPPAEGTSSTLENLWNDLQEFLAPAEDE